MGGEQARLVDRTAPDGTVTLVVEGTEPPAWAFTLEAYAALKNAALTALSYLDADEAKAEAKSAAAEENAKAPPPAAPAPQTSPEPSAPKPDQQVTAESPPNDAVYTTPEGLAILQSDLDRLRDQQAASSQPRLPTRPVLVGTGEGGWEMQEQPGPWRAQEPSPADQPKSVGDTAPDQTAQAGPTPPEPEAVPESSQVNEARTRAVEAEQTRVQGAQEIDASEGDGEGAEALERAGAEVAEARSLLAKASTNDARALKEVDEHLRRAELYRQQASISWAKSRERAVRNGKLGENVATATAVAAVATVGLAGGALVAGSAVTAAGVTAAQALAIKGVGALGGGALALATGGVGESVATGADFLETRLGSGAQGYAEGIPAAMRAPFEGSVALLKWLEDFSRDPGEALAAAVHIPWLKTLIEDPQRLADAIAAAAPQDVARGTGRLIGESAAGAAIGSVGGSVVGGLAGPGGALATATGASVAGAVAGGGTLAALGATAGGGLGALDAVVSMMEGKGDATSDSTPQGRTQSHHTYPKALGGHPDQVLSDLLEDLHTGKGGVHSDLATFEGGWLRPKRGMTGKQIVERYGESNVEAGLRRFYSQEKWRHLLSDFEEAVKFTRKKAQEAAGGPDAP